MYGIPQVQIPAFCLPVLLLFFWHSLFQGYPENCSALFTPSKCSTCCTPTDFTAFCSFTVRPDLIPGGSQQADTSQPPHRFCQNFSNNSDTSRYIHYITAVKFCLVKVRRPRCKFWAGFPWNHNFAHYLRCVFCAFCYHKLRVYNILGQKIQHQLAYCSFSYHRIIFRDFDRTFFVIWSYCGIVSHGILAANIDNMNVRFFSWEYPKFGEYTVPAENQLWQLVCFSEILKRVKMC